MFYVTYTKRNYLHYVYIVRDDKLRCSMLDIVYFYEYTVTYLI